MFAMEEMRLPEENDLRQTGTLWECPQCGHRAEVSDLMAIVANLSISFLSMGVALSAIWFVVLRKSGLDLESGMGRLMDAWPVALVIGAFVVYGGIHAIKGGGLVMSRWRQRVTTKARNPRNGLSIREWRRFRKIFLLCFSSVLVALACAYCGLFLGLPGIAELGLLLIALIALFAPLMLAGAFDLKGQEVMFASGVALVVLTLVLLALAVALGWVPGVRE